ARAWLGGNLHALDPARHVKVVSMIRAGSPDLRALFSRERTGAPLANDTSIGVGYAPLSELERIVLAVERRLNDAETRRVAPDVGEDIKVMGVRHGDRIALTVSCALVGRHV